MSHTLSLRTQATSHRGDTGNPRVPGYLSDRLLALASDVFSASSFIDYSGPQKSHTGA